MNATADKNLIASKPGALVSRGAHLAAVALVTKARRACLESGVRGIGCHAVSIVFVKGGPDVMENRGIQRESHPLAHSIAQPKISGIHIVNHLRALCHPDGLLMLSPEMSERLEMAIGAGDLPLAGVGDDTGVIG